MKSMFVRADRRRSKRELEEGDGTNEKATLSSQTDLSKMSSTGLKAYHSMSTKQSLKAKEPADVPPPRAKPVADVELEERLQIVFVSAEVAPYSKTGGLGDVAGSLPFALAAKGHRIMIITPRHTTSHT